MKHTISLVVVILCLFLISVGFAGPNSRADNVNNRTVKQIVDHAATPYYPGAHQGVLFVEDPGDPGFGPATKPDPVWQGVLDDILGSGNYGWYGATSTIGEDGPDLDTMQGYDLVIWNTYDYWWGDTAALTDNDQTNLGNYMAGGGKVWLIGQDAVWSGVPLAWLQVYFYLQSIVEDYRDTVTVPIHGLAEIDSISIVTTSDYQENPFYPDELVPESQAHAVLEDIDSSCVVGIFYPGADWMSSFWSIDGRTVDSLPIWVDMVVGMLEAFEVYGVAEKPDRELAKKLFLNITPDPMVKSTIIKYHLPINGEVKLEIFNKLGRHIVTLVNDYKYVGSYKVTWHGRDVNEVNVPNGVYFVRLSCGDCSATANLVVVK